MLARDDDEWFKSVDRLLGRVLSGTSIQTSMHGLYGWLDRPVVMRLVQDGLSRMTEQLPSLRGLERREAISAVHTVLVAKTFFESVQQYLTIRSVLRVPSASDWYQEDHSFVSYLYSDDLPVPSITRSFDDTVAAVAVWATDRGERIHRALGRSNPREVSEPLLDLGFARNAAAMYREDYWTSAADIPEFALWTDRTWPALERVMALASTRHVLDGVYVTSNYRLAGAGPATRPADEGWWSSEIEPQQDVELLIATHLTTADAPRTPLLVTGRDGAGKSTLADGLAALLPPDEFTVIRVPLRHIHRDMEVVTQVEHGLRELTQAQVEWHDFTRQNADRQCVVVLDGLDQMLLSTGTRLSYLEEVARFQQTGAGLGHPVAVVVTCRTSFLDQLLIPDGTPIVQLAEFDGAQIGQWVDAWNRANPERPMALETALDHLDLARNPFMLSMLAEHVTDEATRQPSGPLSMLELYQLLRTNRGVSPHVLATAALGMFNRGRQTITEDELRADLTALGDHRLDAAGSALRDLEGLPATFTEFLIAADLMETLYRTAVMSGIGKPNDELLFALLSHRPLAVRPATLTFTAQLAEEMEPGKRAALTQVLDDLIEGYRRRRDPGRYARYQPTTPDAIRSLAAYSANLVLLLLFIDPTGEVSGSRGLADLWSRDLDADGHRAVLSLLSFDGDAVVRRSVREAPQGKQLGIEIVHRSLSAGPHTIGQVTWSSDGQLVTANSGGVVTFWEIAANSAPKDVARLANVSDVAWHPTRPIAAFVQRSKEKYPTAPFDGYSLKVTSFEGRTTRTLCFVAAHTRISWSPNGDSLAMLDAKGLWILDATTGEQQQLFEYGSVGGQQTRRLVKPRWSADGEYIWAANADTVRACRVGNRALTFSGTHLGSEPLDLIVFTDTHRLIALASPGGTGIKIDSLRPDRAPVVLEGHTKRVTCAKFSPDGDYLASMSVDNTVRIWRCADWQCVAVLPREDISRRGGLAFHPTEPLLAVKDGNHVDIVRLVHQEPDNADPPPSSRHYANAKVVLVGDTGVGKSGLGLVLSGQPFEPTESTHGRNVWTFEKSYATTPSGAVQTRETLLWDLAGQPGYRMVHQLHLNEVAVALVVFDARSETDPFAGVRYWSRALTQARRLDGAAAVRLRAYLVAARTDRGGTAVGTARIEQAVRALGFDGYVETSAKEGWGVDELVRTVRDAIDWDAVPAVSSNALFQAIKDFVLEEKKQGRILTTVDDLLHSFRRVHRNETPVEELKGGFEACVGRLESVGVVRRMAFGDYVLLRPELLDAYASSLVQAAKDEPDGLGFVAEADALEGRFRMPESERLTNSQQERILLNTVVQELLGREIALKEHTDREVDLIFPSQFTRERPDAPRLPGQDVVFTFDGPLYSIYSTLAVRLSHSRFFRRDAMWHNSASYVALAGGTCGIAIREVEEGKGELVLFYDDAQPIVRRQFEAYVVEHLEQRAVADTVVLRRVRRCKPCNYAIDDEVVQRRLSRNLTTVTCQICDEVIPIVDEPVVGDVRPAVAQMNSNANAQRDQDVAATTLKGKHEAGDYDVFLCHNVKDKPQVLRIARELEARGILPWLDVRAIPPGSRWQNEMEKGIERSRSAAVLVGPAGFGPWHDAEMHLINDWSVRTGKRVIPVILEGTSDDLGLPGFLRVWSTVDTRQPDPDPIDLLVWGITGEPPRWV